jgi:hypothetical protein
MLMTLSGAEGSSTFEQELCHAERSRSIFASLQMNAEFSRFSYTALISQAPSTSLRLMTLSGAEGSSTFEQELCHAERSRSIFASLQMMLNSVVSPILH